MPLNCVTPIDLCDNNTGHDSVIVNHCLVYRKEEIIESVSVTRIFDRQDNEET